MKKTIRLSNEARIILKKLSTPELTFLKSIKEDKGFSTFSEIVNTLIDLEKNQFFGDNESAYENPVWQARHAYARGGVAKLILLTNIIVAAGSELEAREEERKKK